MLFPAPIPPVIATAIGCDKALGGRGLVGGGGNGLFGELFGDGLVGDGLLGQLLGDRLLDDGFLE